MRSNDAANPTKAMAIMIFFLLLDVNENMIAATAETNPTVRAVFSPPSVDNNIITANAPNDAPIRSAAYNLPAIAANELSAVEMTIPMKKNGIVKRNMNNGR